MTNPKTPETRTMPISEIGNQGGIGMWPSEDWASKLYDFANWGLLIGLLLCVFSTALLVWMGKLKEEYLKRDLATANLHAAEAIQKAEEEHLARVRIEEKLSGWKLDAAAQARVIERLKKYEKTRFDLGANPAEVIFYGSDGWNFGIRWMGSASTQSCQYPVKWQSSHKLRLRCLR